MFDRVNVLGVEIGAVSLPQAADLLSGWIRHRDQQYVCVQGVHGVMESQENPALKKAFNQAGLTTPDGMPMVWCGKFLGQRHMSRVYGPDLFEEMAARASEEGWSFFYYGGKDGVADLLAEAIQKDHPGVKTAGTYCPPFRPLTDEEKTDVAQMINESGADVVWVGLSTPKQDLWMAEMRPLLEAPVLVGVGAAFDFRTGLVPQAPGWMQRNGLEWLFRALSEPARLGPRYLKCVPAFMLKILTRPPKLIKATRSG